MAKIVCNANHFVSQLIMPMDSSRQAAAEQPFFGHLLMGVSRTWRQVLEVRLAEMGLTDATWVPLFHLHDAGQPLTLKQLAERVGLDSSTLVRVVDMLESRGLLQRTTDAHDRRSKSLHLTGEGLHVVADVRTKLHQVDSQLLEGMDATTTMALRHGLEQLHARLARIQQEDKAGV